MINHSAFSFHFPREPSRFSEVFQVLENKTRGPIGKKRPCGIEVRGELWSWLETSTTGLSDWWVLRTGRNRSKVVNHQGWDIKTLVFVWKLTEN